MPSTRRHTLRSAAGALAALAGCSAENRSRKDTTPSPHGPPADALTDPPALTLRNPEAAPVVTRGTPTPTEDEGRFWGHRLVVDDETASTLTVADVEGADRAREFLDATDFEGETVYVEQREIGECYERTLCWVKWTDSSIETAYSRGFRDADVACETDAKDVVAHLIRLPVALDPDRISGYGSQTTSGHCRSPDEDRTGEGSA